MTSRQPDPRKTPKGSFSRLESESPQTESRTTSAATTRIGHSARVSRVSVIPEQGLDLFPGRTPQDGQSHSRILQPSRYDELATPSSTIAEFGDKAARSVVPSATELVDHIHRSWSNSREGFRSVSKSRSRSISSREPREPRSRREERKDRGRNTSIASIVPAEERSETSTPKQSRHGRSRGPRERSISADKAMLTDEKVNRFLHSMKHHQPPTILQASQTEQTGAFEKQTEIDNIKNLTAENKGLYQRVAALQLTERELLAENQKLIRQVAALNHQLVVAVEELETAKQQQDAHNHHWHKVFTEKEDQHQKRIHEIGAQLIDLSSTHPDPKRFKPLVSDEEIAIWFMDQDAAWRAWARAYGHQDPNRLVDGLHPAQLRELCEEVRGFVQLTNVEKLPAAILHGGKEATHTLLQAMLANFFCTEILGNPYWVFTAASVGTLESPSVSLPHKAWGLRVNMNMFGTGGNDVAGSRGSVSSLERSSACHVPKSSRLPPALDTSIPSSMLGLPLKNEMERLQFMLLDAQDNSSAGQHGHWRAHMMRLFATGGMSMPPAHPSAASSISPSRQTLIDARLNYARKLREMFLGGAARFLLHDQDAPGIERLERVLTEMIDDALRFSCKLWSRTWGVGIRGWRDLSELKGGFKTGMKTVGICQAQDNTYYGPEDPSSENDKQASDGNEGRPVIMVVQPAIEAVAGFGDDERRSLVWLRARVMVAAPVEEPVPGSGASDADFAPSPVELRDETVFQKRDLVEEGRGDNSRTNTPKVGVILPACSYVGHPARTKIAEEA
ncbi:hypothetical protein QBC40DRAFT_224498 [Triangularia verruculosa]|uniref:Uncharacterized protein n=1 Tax=Triangularia verruculosa TaxID=2587418 RepID=A0AAN6XHW0_9PEZI|nr:hypothetical protein QBC40DRAFT_224498 [Triangularia verruculosa]